MFTSRQLPTIEDVWAMCRGRLLEDFAQLLLRQPHYAILDEATSALDLVNEQRSDRELGLVENWEKQPPPSSALGKCICMN
jgi:hypothetical protein